MSEGYKKVFWGFIFLTFHINFVGFKMLPSFIAYMIIYYGIKKIYENYDLEGFKICGRLCIVLSVLSFFSLVIEGSPGWGIGNNVFFNLIWMNIFNVLEIIMIYMLLWGSSEILKDKNNSLHESYNKRVIKYIILESIAVIAKNINMIFMSEILWGCALALELGLKIWIIVLSKEMYKISLKHEEIS